MSRRVLLSYLSLAAIVLLVLEIPLGVAYARGERTSYARSLERDAVYAASLAEDTLQYRTDPASLRAVASRYGEEEDAQLAIVDRNGRLVTRASPRLRRLLGSAEAAQALSGHPTTGSSNGLVFAAVPVSSSGVVHGAVLVAAPTEEVDSRVNSYFARLAAIAVGVLGLVALVGWMLARSVTRPLQAVERAVASAGAGDLKSRAPEDAGPPEVRGLARAFNDMAERLEQLLQAQEAFVADASHQLRTPLTALRLRLENGDNEGALRETERLSRLVDGLLALARAEAEQPEPLDLATLVRERIEAWDPVAGDRGVQIEGDDVHGVALVNADRFAQVLDNLLANAIAVAPRGSSIAVVGDAGSVHVLDEGPGMTALELEHAFDRFWSRSHGSGLGLPIARRLLAVDGADIALSNRDGGGLDVTLRLRRATDARHEGETPSASFG
jgi:signal transduction histidine kinase